MPLLLLLGCLLSAVGGCASAAPKFPLASRGTTLRAVANADAPHPVSATRLVSAEAIQARNASAPAAVQAVPPRSGHSEATAAPATPPPSSVEPLATPRQPYAIDLPTALRLADAQNTEISLAQERIEEALAQLEQADLLLVPTLSAGASYHKHDGRIQETDGTVLEASRSSGYAGLGAGALGAGPILVPGVRLQTDLADAIFLPLVGRQTVRAREAQSRAVRNSVLLEVVVAYEELLRAYGARAIARESLENAADLAHLTEQYARTGEGLQSDAERAAVEQAVREQQGERASEEAAVRSAQLVELLRLDPLVQLEPIDPAIAPLHLVPGDRPLAELIATALENRPELEQNRALVQAACGRLRQAKYGPLLPTLVLNYSVGEFGGGPATTIGNSSDRSDLDAMAYWDIKNLGLGDRALTRERRSQYRQAQTAETAALDRIASEVTQANAQVASRRKRVDLAEAAVTRALNSVRLNRARIYEKQGLPIEALQSIESLASSRQEYLDAVIDYNQAQFRLYTALGQPALDTAPTTPVITVPRTPEPNESGSDMDEP